MKKIGLTGGIGVGKTYVSKVLQQMGIAVFYADVEAKFCIAEDKGLMQNVKTSFGENMYDNGVLQKEELAKIVFNNSERLAELNALVHPVVKQRFEDCRLIKSQALVTGIVKVTDDKLRAEFRLWDVIAAKEMSKATPRSFYRNRLANPLKAIPTSPRPGSWHKPP